MGTPEKKAWFRDYMVADTEKRQGRPFSNLTAVDQSKAMTTYYVRDVLSRVMPGAIPSDEADIEDSLVDGRNDLGIDFLWKQDDSVLIIQSKYHAPKKHEEIAQVSHFCNVLVRLYNATSSGAFEMNRKLAEAATDIDWDNDSFQLHFLTLGKAGDNIHARVAEGVDAVPALPDLQDRVDLQFCAETDLNERLREALSADDRLEDVSISFRPGDEGEPWITFYAGKRKMYVGQVSGAELASLYRQHKVALFSLNIRDYVGETATNKGIVETALNRPDEFAFFNNGVSAIATDVQPDRAKSTLTCTRLSIINGAQTVRSLRKAEAKSKNRALSEARVLFRVSTFSLGKDSEFLSDITRYNNTQNAIKISDFRSNDPVQKDLARRFASVTRNGKRYWYKNKRSRESHPERIAVGLEDFAKTIHAFRFGPNDMWGGTKYLFDVSPKGGYVRVFGEPVSQLSDGDFEVLAGTYFICEYTKGLWEEQKEQLGDEESLHAGLERRWMAYFAVAELLRLAYNGESGGMEADLRALSRPQWLDESRGTTKECLADLYTAGSNALMQAYDNAASAPDFRHRNWFRDEGTLAAVKSIIKLIPGYRGARNPLPRLRAMGASRGI